MDNQGLLFIPDISGYTHFINNTEIEHSRYIIQELLEILVNSNRLKLEISEIEGDAILFYRFGKSPTVEEMYRQVEAMFCNFHKFIRQYESRRICPCKACEGAKDLSLKVISHYGEFSTYTVRDFNKLIGKDVITAHQLLKNDIPLHEYWLLTDGLYRGEENEKLPGWIEWKEGKKEENAGVIDYHYSMLSQLKEELPEDKEEFGIKGDAKMLISMQQDFDVNIEEMFGLIVDYSKRPEWMDGIKRIEGVSTTIPQVGTVHKCIADQRVNIVVTSGFKMDDKKILIEESDIKGRGTGQIILEKLGEKKTRMHFNFLLKNNAVMQLMFGLFMKKKMEKQLRNSFIRLEAYFKREKRAA